MTKKIYSILWICPIIPIGINRIFINFCIAIKGNMTIIYKNIKCSRIHGTTQKPGTSQVIFL